MTSREAIFSSIRANKPKLDRPLPDVPLYDQPTAAAPVDAFIANLKAMGGSYLIPEGNDPAQPILDRLSTAKVVCSVVPEIRGNRTIDASTPQIAVEDVDIAIVRAAFGVVETGSICLTENELVINSLGYLAQHLIVLFDVNDLVPNIHHAYRRNEWRTANYAVFHTGPSATADIEGVLVHGAQGVRSLTVIQCPRHSPNGGGT